jgi:hypothetical protein
LVIVPLGDLASQVDDKHQCLSQTQAAELLNVSQKSVENARKILLEGTPGQAAGKALAAIVDLNQFLPAVMATLHAATFAGRYDEMKGVGFGRRPY